MSNGSSESASSFRWNNVVLGVAVVALAAMSWAYFEQRNAARTQATASAETLAAVQAALDEEKAKPITLEYAREIQEAKARLYVQVQSGKTVRFYNNTSADDLEITFQAGLFPDQPNNPFTVEPKKWVDTTVDDQAADGKVYVLLTTDTTDHGGSEMIVGSGP